MPDGAVSLDVRFAKIGEDAVPFDDVFSSDWFFEPVRYVYENGLMIGVSDTLFGPQNVCHSRHDLGHPRPPGKRTGSASWR